MIRSNSFEQSDYIGALASMLCVVHCLATPFIFMASAHSAAGCHAAPLWYRSLEIVFIAISFIAIFHSARRAKKSWIKYGLYTLWGTLMVLFCIQWWHLIAIPAWLLYIPSISLAGLHFYNIRDCKCQQEQCCVNH